MRVCVQECSDKSEISLHHWCKEMVKDGNFFDVGFLWLCGFLCFFCVFLWLFVAFCGFYCFLSTFAF